MRAALIYQHAMTDRDRAIAEALGTLVYAGREGQDDDAGQHATGDDEDPDDGASGPFRPGRLIARHWHGRRRRPFP